MTKLNGATVYLALMSFALLLVGCSDVGDEIAGRSRENVLRLDQDAAPAPHNLILLRERPMFPSDASGREYGAIEDISDRSMPANEPREFGETRR